MALTFQPARSDQASPRCDGSPGGAQTMAPPESGGGIFVSALNLDAFAFAPRTLIERKNNRH
jgi:hypothetical protein